MNELIKFTEDKIFVRWVLRPNKQLDSFWEEYKKNNPEEKEQIEIARVLILNFKTKKTDIDVIETDKLFSGIMKGIEEQSNGYKIRRLSISILKYAAIAVSVIFLGIGFHYYKKPSDFELTAQSLVDQTTDYSGNSQLILSNGKKITINDRNSHVEHLNNGNIVVNRKDTVLINEYDNHKLNQLIVPQGRNSTIQFADGTIVFVNAGSHLVYPSVFKDNKRQVFLVGEGFFEVKHQSDIPFVACTNHFEIEVLGTKFNLSAYPSENNIETVLIEGKVKVQETGFNFTNNQQVLNPMQKAVFNRNNAEIEISNVDDTEYVTWYKGYLNFKSTDLATIVKKLERHFNVEIKLNTTKLESKIISGKLKLQDENMDTVVQVLAFTASLSMEKLNETTYILK